MITQLCNQKCQLWFCLQKTMKLSVYGPLEITSYEEFVKQSKENFESRWMKKIEYEEKLSDFEIIEVLGHGTFGEVVLVKNKLSQRHNLHAMKIIEKKRVVEKKQIENTKTEKNILQSMDHPLVVSIDFFFQDNSFLYIIMPHILGGELFTHLRKFGRFEEEQAKFYSAQMVLALEYLHFLNFIHRDLKPENILIDHTGYLKLADFGFCKRMDKGRTYTLCGTPEYMAPEVVLHKGYGLSADWWSLGILLYEMNSGNSPFYSRNTGKIFKRIISNNYKMPPHFSHDLRDIIHNLLQDNISKRYGNLKNGTEDIKGHKWFRSISWLGVLSRKTPAPYKPPIKKPGSKSGTSLPTSKINVIAEIDRYKSMFEDF